MNGRKILSFLLVICLLLGNVTPAVHAVESAPEMTVDSEQLIIEGSNSFGTMLSERIQPENGEGDRGGYTVTDLVIEGRSATVTYDALEDATLVVALYTEDGIQLLNSASRAVSAETTFATVSFQGEMPEYFFAAAYLVDSEDCSPLCPAYETPMYTKVMQELLDATVEDFDADLVLNLDENTDTNFAVYSEDTIQVEPAFGVNTVSKADDQNLVYVIENADSQFRNLKKGDVVSYPYGEADWLIVKVASVSVRGKTVTIHGDDSLTMEEVFSYVKLENEVDASDATVEDLDPNDGIEMVESDGPMLLAADDDVTFKKSLKFQFLDVKKISGSLDLSLEGTLHYYQSGGYHYNRFKITYAIGVFFSVEGKVEIRNKEFANLYLASIPLAGVMLSPSLDFSVSGKMEFSATVTGDLGINYASGREPINLCTRPRVEKKWEFEGEAFLGIDLHPAAFLVHEKVFEVSLSTPVGATIEAKMEGTDFVEILAGTDQPELHDCAKCLSGSCSIGVEVSADIKVAGFKHVSLTKKYHVKLGNIPFYYSFTYDEMGEGTCPHTQYLVTFEIVDGYGDAVENVAVKPADFAVYTNTDGIARAYLPDGRYSVTFSYQNVSGVCQLKVNGKARKCKVSLEENTFVFADYIGAENIGSVTDGGQIESGSCGESAYWTYYENGTLVISGTGKMEDYVYSGSQPWPYTVTEVIIEEGITHIGNGAFSLRGKLKNITIPDSVITIGENAFSSCAMEEVIIPNSVIVIGDSAFAYCQNLKRVVIPDSVTSLGKYAFSTCTALQNVELSGNVGVISGSAFHECTSLETIEIPEGITTIDAYAFDQCYALQSVKLPESLETIGVHAFSDCTQLRYIKVPATVTRIDSFAFSGAGLEQVDLTDNIVFIGEQAFYKCEKLKSFDIPRGITETSRSMLAQCISLTNVTIPDTITTISYGTFHGCQALTDVSLPDSVTVIEDSAFSSCSNLKKIQLPDSVVSVGKDAFSYSGLEFIELPDGIKTIKQDTFEGCKELTQIVIPDSVTSIESAAFKYCASLGEIYIPDNVTEIGEYAFWKCSALKKVRLSENLFKIANNLFLECSELETIVIPENVAYIGSSVFEKCSRLRSVTLPTRLVSMGESVFNQCSSLVDIVLPEGLTKIPSYVFQNCSSLEEITIPANIISIGLYSFASCDNLKTVYFLGDAPNMLFNTFYNTTANVYYDGEWQEDMMQNYGGTLTWIPYDGGVTSSENEAVTALSTSYEEKIDADTEEAWTEDYLEESVSDDIIDMTAVYGGEYGTEETDSYTVKTATFSGLAPNEEYLLLALVEIKTEKPLDPNNLLFIDQGVSEPDGTLSFRYVPRMETEISYVVACGPSNKNLSNAVITFPEMMADGEIHAVDPVVQYGGKTLEEGLDYLISGEVSYSKLGTYTCYIEGIHNYTGEVICSYSVLGENSKEEVKRLAGDSRYETSFAIATEMKAVLGIDKFNAVVLANSDNFADALAGSYLAAQKQAPIIIGKEKYKSLVCDYLNANLAEGATVYILGGEDVMPDSILANLNVRHKRIRLAGDDRYLTNLEILNHIPIGGSDVLVATGRDFADSLSASATGLPILLVNGKAGKSLTAEQKAFLATVKGDIYIIGGESAVPESMVEQIEVASGKETERIAGGSRYETSVKIAEKFLGDATSGVVAYASTFPDGLCGGALAYVTKSPLILSKNGKTEAPAYAEAAGIRSGYVLGSGELISDGFAKSIFQVAEILK